MNEFDDKQCGFEKKHYLTLLKSDFKYVSEQGLG